MKIIKRPENVIYDTDKPNEMKFNPVPFNLLTPMDEVTGKSDWDFLSEKFKPVNGFTHPVFKDFRQSYYYCMTKKNK